MDSSANPERAGREAYAAYNRLLWQLAQLPAGAPERKALEARLVAAERAWRERAVVPDIGHAE